MVDEQMYELVTIRVFRYWYSLKKPSKINDWYHPRKGRTGATEKSKLSHFTRISVPIKVSWQWKTGTIPLNQELIENMTEHYNS